MHLISVKTRILTPPLDNLFLVLTDALPPLKEKDVVLISSKVVAIHEGRTRRIGTVDEAVLVAEAADLIIPRP